MIYFIHAPEVGRLKIGFSDGVSNRYMDLANASPTPLFLLTFVEGSVQEEKRAHALFRHCRYRGEWFRAEDDLLAFVHELASLEDAERRARLLAAFADNERRRAERKAALASGKDEQVLRDCVKAFIEAHGRALTVGISGASRSTVLAWLTRRMTITGPYLLPLIAHDPRMFEPFFGTRLVPISDDPAPKLENLSETEIDGAIKALTALKVRAERLRAA